MTDFRQSVRGRLSRLRLGNSVMEDVVEEISSHLQITAEELTSRGLVPDEADAYVLAQATDWNKLLRGIQQTKGNVMKERLRKLWFPALGTGLLAYTALFLIARLVPWPRFVLIEGNYVSYTWQWYPVLILVGAIGAYWSQQSGGTRRERILVVSAPSIVIALLMIGVLPLEFIESWVVYHELPYLFFHPIVFVALLTAWAVVPAIPLLLGALPFLSERKSARWVAVSE